MSKTKNIKPKKYKSRLKQKKTIMEKVFILFLI